MTHNVLVLPGDGIGPEIVAEAQKVLHAVDDKFNLGLNISNALVGGSAIDVTGGVRLKNSIQPTIGKQHSALSRVRVGDPKCQRSSLWLTRFSARARRKRYLCPIRRPTHVVNQRVLRSPDEIFRRSDLLLSRRHRSDRQFRLMSHPRRRILRRIDPHARQFHLLSRERRHVRQRRRFVQIQQAPSIGRHRHVRALRSLRELRQRVRRASVPVRVVPIARARVLPRRRPAFVTTARDVHASTPSRDGVERASRARDERAFRVGHPSARARVVQGRRGHGDARDAMHRRRTVPRTIARAVRRRENRRA